MCTAISFLTLTCIIIVGLNHQYGGISRFENWNFVYTVTPKMLLITIGSGFTAAHLTPNLYYSAIASIAISVLVSLIYITSLY